MGIAILTNDSEKSQTLSDTFVANASEFLAMLLRLKEDRGQKKAIELAITAIDAISTLYVEDAKANWLARGTYFEGTYMMDDITVCNDILDFDF